MFSKHPHCLSYEKNFLFCLIGFMTTGLIGSGLKKVIHPLLCPLYLPWAAPTGCNELSYLPKKLKSLNPALWEGEVARDLLSKREKNIHRKCCKITWLLRNTLQAAYTRLRPKPHLSFPEPLDGALQRSFQLGLEGENLALVRTGRRPSEVEMGMRDKGKTWVLCWAVTESRCKGGM